MKFKKGVESRTLISQMGGFKSKYKIQPKKDVRKGLFEPRKTIKERKIE